MSDAAEAIFTRAFSEDTTGKFFIDDEVLLGCGVSPGTFAPIPASHTTDS
jgi:hypothetical protein